VTISMLTVMMVVAVVVVAVVVIVAATAHAMRVFMPDMPTRVVVVVRMSAAPVERDAEHAARSHADSNLREQDQRKEESQGKDAHGCTFNGGRDRIA
jgi:flagellar biosynthesis/type III secretory pathway M-ring protein FliF/YscJ